MKSFKVFSSICLLALFSLISGRGWGQQAYYSMSSGNYSQNFSDIANWTNNFAAGLGASNFSSVGVIGSGTSVTSGTRTTKSSSTFVTASTGGIQKGTQALIFLSTGSSTPAEAVAVDLFLDFSNRQVGTISYDWLAVDNANGTRPTSLRIFWSIDGSTFTEISSAQILDQVSPNSGSVTNIGLPTQINGASNVILRFYNHAGTITGGGSRDKIQIDNISITSSALSSSPTLTTPTVSSITASSAVLGANITNDGGSAISARGTVYSTSSPVTSGNNASAEGGVSTGVFTQSRTGLSAQSQYYYAGYATNSTGTGLSSEGSFRTLSNPTTSQASGLTATVSSASQIDLSITNAAGFPASGATQGGYLLIYSTSTPTLGSSNGQAPNASVGTIFSTPAAVLSSATPSTSINVTGLSSSTAYNFTIIPYTWDGTNSATYNYLVTNAVTVSATTNAGLPTLISPAATSITSSSATLGANVTSNGGSNLTARGTVYSTSSPVSSGNNALAEGGTSTGVFTQNRTSLNPQTLYYFAGYATSSAGTSLSAEGSFRTLSEAPTSQVSSINATASSPSEIGLSIGGANFPNSGATNAGYVIIYSTGTPTFASINGQAPSAGVGTIFSTTSTVLPLNPANTINISGLLSSTTYNFLVVPYTWDGSNATTYNYLT
ncbi:MAG: hypothetical protein RL349_1543, partial [Bacteroidota bacterium]